jgi:hypothetical protein
MKRVAWVILAVLAVSMSASAQGGRGAPAPAAPLEPGASQADVDKAVLALPENLRNLTMVIKWKPDFTYDTLRKGTNGLVCWDRSGFPLQQPFAIECSSTANIERAAQNLKGEAVGDRAKANEMFNEQEKNGTRVKPAFGSVWYHLSGPDREHARPHMTIAVPGATAQSLGLPDKATQNGIWIMNAGTSTAHLMVPGE